MSGSNEKAGIVSVKRRKRRRVYWRLLRIASVVSLLLTTGLWVVAYRNWTIHYSGGLYVRWSGVDGALLVEVYQSSQNAAVGPAAWKVTPANLVAYNQSPFSLVKFRTDALPSGPGTIRRVEFGCDGMLLWAIAGILPFTLLVILPWARRALDPRGIESVQIDPTVPP